jgi:hypothetical protein
VAAIPKPDAQACGVLLDTFRCSDNVVERAAGYGYVTEPYHFSGLLAEYATALRTSAQTGRSHALLLFDSWLASRSPRSSEGGVDSGNDSEDDDNGLGGAGSLHGNEEHGSSPSDDGNDSDDSNNADDGNDAPSTDQGVSEGGNSSQLSNQLRRIFNLRDLDIRLTRCDAPG